MFRYKSGCGRSYNQQGYICFASKLYAEMGKENRKKIENLCRECGGDYHAALLEFVTTEKTATKICMEHYISKATLYRAVRKYYKRFEIDL